MSESTDTPLQIEDIDFLLRHPIAYHPVFADIAGGPLAGLFLSQVFYWSRKYAVKRLGWFYLTIEQWEDQTRLTRAMINTARTKVGPKGLNLVEERVDHKGFEKKLYYRINIPVFVETLQKHRQQFMAKKIDPVPDEIEPGFWLEEVAQDQATLLKKSGNPLLSPVSLNQDDRCAGIERTGDPESSSPVILVQAHASAGTKTLGALESSAPNVSNQARGSAGFQRASLSETTQRQLRENNNAPSAQAEPEVVVFLQTVRVGKDRKPLARWVVRDLANRPLNKVKAAVDLYNEELGHNMDIPNPHAWIYKAATEEWEAPAPDPDVTRDIADDDRQIRDYNLTKNGRDALALMQERIAGLDDESFMKQALAAVERATTGEVRSRYQRRMTRDNLRLTFAISNAIQGEEGRRKLFEQMEELRKGQGGKQLTLTVPEPDSVQEEEPSNAQA